MMYWPGGGGWGGWGFGLMGIGMLLVWVLVIVGLVILIRYLVRGDRRSAPTPAAPPTPERILAERFARGEIDEEEYHRRLDTLRGAGPSDT